MQIRTSDIDKFPKKVYNKAFFSLVNKFITFELIKQPILNDHGFVLNVIDNVAVVVGLYQALSGDFIFFDNGTQGRIFYVQPDYVKIIIFKKASLILESDLVCTSYFKLNKTLILRSYQER